MNETLHNSSGWIVLYYGGAMQVCVIHYANNKMKPFIRYSIGDIVVAAIYTILPHFTIIVCTQYFGVL